MISPTINAFLDQLRVLWLLSSRPVVQKQLAAFLAVLLLGWLVGYLIGRLQTHTPEEQETTNRRRFLRGLRYLYWPVLTLVLGIIVAETLFAQQIATLHLYDNLINLVWILLVYRLVVALFYARLSQTAAQQYHRGLLTPLFAMIVLSLIVQATIGSLETLSQIALFSFGEFSLTLGTLTAVLMILYVTIVCSRIFQDILYHQIAPRLDSDLSAMHSVGTIGRYCVITIGILFALRALGLNLSSFAIIGGGLSVGIGFGMQQIVANFFAGLILLFERTLRPGDVIKLDNEVGVIEKLNIRSTVVRTFDNVEVIVPNETFLTSRLVSYTKTDRLVRLSLPVGTGYNSDPEQVRDLLTAAAQSHPAVLAEPAPTIFFKGFGDSSIDFDVTVWLDEPTQIPHVRSDLHFAIWKQFAQHDIEIPFPQRDLNLGQGWEQLLPQRAA